MFAVKMRLNMSMQVEHLLQNMMTEIRYAYNDYIALIKEQDAKMRESEEYKEAVAVPAEELRVIRKARKIVRAWPLDRDGNYIFDSEHPEQELVAAQLSAERLLPEDLIYRYHLTNAQTAFGAFYKTIAEKHPTLVTAVINYSIAAPAYRAYQDFLNNQKDYDYWTEKGKTDLKEPCLQFKSYKNPVTSITSDQRSPFKYSEGKVTAYLPESKKARKERKAGHARKKGPGQREGTQKYILSVPQSEFSAYTLECLQNKVKTVTLKCETIRGKSRWFLILAVEGTPPQSSKAANLGKGTVGFASSDKYGYAVSEKEVRCVEYGSYSESTAEYKNRLDTFYEKISVLQTEFNRLMKLNNPERYNANGTCKKYQPDMPPLKYSYRMRQLKLKINELNRHLAAYRKWSHQNQVCHLISVGKDFAIYDAQIARKRIKEGKPINEYAPKLFAELLSQKVEHNDGTATAFIHQKGFSPLKFNHIINAEESVEGDMRIINGVEIDKYAYAAFLMQFVQAEPKRYGSVVKNVIIGFDIQKCELAFPRFLKNYQKI